ncbi:MAG TPA: tetratricopeptide repeat protein [Pirellulales bacterium]|nr:tetratricopeptide repeat protein [Pirellulales bacterium]
MSRPSPPSTFADIGIEAIDDVTAALVEALIVELNERWALGERPRAEELLARHPELAGRPEAAVELIYEEICLRQQHTTAPTPSELFSRFPQWRAQLELLLDCHRLLEESPAPSFPRAGETLGEFQLLTELGRGARGRVFLARQPALADRAVVLKLAAADGQEHLSLARLQHTHIVPLYGVQDFPERALRGLCMPYFGGVTFDKLFAALGAYSPAQRHGHHLLDALRRLSADSMASMAGANGAATGAEPRAPSSPAGETSDGQLPARWSYVETVCWLTALLADALHYAHQRGLLHLDLKPSNVLLAADGQPMLLDFHLARAPLEKGVAAPEWLGGTPGYVSPELAEAFEAVRAGGTVPITIDGRADVYSLGRLLLEALAGALPPPEAPAIEVWLRRRNSRVSLALADLVAKCVAHDPRDRYLDASHLAADLRRHLADQPLRGVANRSLLERWRKWRRRRPHALTLVALLVVVVGAVALSIVEYRQERRKAELALSEGRERLDRRDYVAALGTLHRGIELAENLPFCGDLIDSLREDFRQAQRAVAAGELHDVTDRLRATFGAESPTSAESRELEAHCRRFWEQRQRIAEWFSENPSAGFERQVETDLLDLAILWADLRVRLATGGDVALARREALEILDEAESFAGPSAVVHLERQVHAAALGPDEAASEPQRHADLAPRTAWEHFALGRALLRWGRLDEAAAHFDTAIDLEPHALWTNCYLGKCAYERGRYADAAIAFTACAVLAPDSGWCFYNRGLAFAKQGDTERARRDFDRAVKLDPGLARAIENLRIP